MSQLFLHLSARVAIGCILEFTSGVTGRIVELLRLAAIAYREWIAHIDYYPIARGLQRVCS